MTDFWNMFSYAFMQRALIAVVLLGVILPILGLNATTKRLSMIGDTLSHTALAGVAIGLASGTLPVPMAIGVSVAMGILIEIVRTKFTKYSELTLAIVMSFAVGIAGLMTKFAPGNQFEKYLFGSLLIVTDTDVWIIVGLFFLVVLYSLAFYRTNMYLSYSANEAKVSGLPVWWINLLQVVLTAASVAVSSSIIGSLLVSSMLVLPVACTLQVFKSYFKTMMGAIVLSVLSGFVGLVISYPLGTNTGSTIVLLVVGILLSILLIKGAIQLGMRLKAKAKDRTLAK